MEKILVLLLCLGIAGCTYGEIAQRNSNKMLTLNKRQTKQEVLQVMGNPHRNEKYDMNGKDVDIWFYRTSWSEDGLETDDEFTPMVFEDGKLIGWGRNFYDQKIKLQSEIKQNITIKQE